MSARAEASTATAYEQELDPWETAYLRFETPEEEIRKFVRRLRGLGVHRWPKELDVIELFCGRANGLRALEQLGFHRLTGADLSSTLTRQYAGRARIMVCDCRQLPMPDASQDVAVIQGGLHHLADLARDLPRTLTEVHRILRDRGRVVIIEPWRTPFLDLAHAVSRMAIARRLSRKVDAFATMVEHERVTYERWLSHADTILRCFRSTFQIELLRVRWGKLSLMAQKPHRRRRNFGASTS